MTGPAAITTDAAGYTDIVFMQRSVLSQSGGAWVIPPLTQTHFEGGQLTAMMAQARESLLRLHPAAYVEEHMPTEGPGFFLELGQFDLDICGETLCCSIYPSDWHLTEEADAAFRQGVIEPLAALGYVPILWEAQEVLDNADLGFSFSFKDALGVTPSREAHATPVTAQTAQAPTTLAPGEQARPWWQFW